MLCYTFANYDSCNGTHSILWSIVNRLPVWVASLDCPIRRKVSNCGVTKHSHCPYGWIREVSTNSANIFRDSEDSEGSGRCNVVSYAKYKAPRAQLTC